MNDYQHWREKAIDEDRWVYIWADGIYSGLRSDKDKTLRDGYRWSQ